MVINLLKIKKNLHQKIFTYLIIFSLLIVASIWIFQIFFLNNYYEAIKTNELYDTIKTIKSEYDKDSTSIQELLEKYSFDRGVCAEVYNDNEVYYTSNPMSRGCLNFFDRDQGINKKKIEFISSNESEFKLRIVTERDDNKIILMGIKLDDHKTIFINTSIEPIDSTVQILKNQFITITIIVIIMSLILAYFIAKKLSKPISKLTTKSKDLSKGNFDVDFNVNSNIIEIDELSDSLNYSKDVLKKNDELRRELMANVSHDLKTPLTMIKAYAEKVRDISYKDDVKREKDLSVIMEEVDRLNILVNDILNLSKLENNIDELNIEELNLSNLVDTIIERFKIFSVTQDCHFIKHYKKDIKVSADKQKLEQVIYNLIGNAINYSDEDKNVYITMFERKNEVRVFITDTGPGIKEEKIKDIWNKYYKIDKKYKRNVVGTGLGLSIVKHIFDLHNYKYGVISKEDIGTTFYFIIDKQNRKK